MAFFPGNPRSDNRKLGEEAPPTKRSMDAEQEAMLALNRALADAQKLPSNLARGAAVPGGTSLPQPFKVRVGG